MATHEEISVSNSFSFIFIKSPSISKYFSNPDEPQIICNECGKSYKTKTQFRMHQIAAHLEKTHQCSDCGKKYPFAVELLTWHEILEINFFC